MTSPHPARFGRARLRATKRSALAPYRAGSWSGHGELFSFFWRSLERNFVLDSGEVKIETRGFTGKACIQESQFLKDLLGKEISQQLTPAYYLTGKEKTSIKKHLPLFG